MRNDIRHALFFAFAAFSLSGLTLHGSASIASEASPAVLPATATAAASVAAAALPLATTPAATAASPTDTRSQEAARSTGVEKRCDHIKRIGKVRITRCQ